MIITLGGVVYPNPPLTRSRPRIAPVALIIGFAKAPLPVDPEILITGGPQGNCEVLHGGAEDGSDIKEFVIEDKPADTSSKAQLAPFQKLH